MDNESETIRLEIEKLRLERLKVYGNILTVLITVVIGTFGVAYMNNAFQNRQLKQQQLRNEAELQLQQKRTEMELQLQQKKTETELQLQEKMAEAERRQAEMQYLGDFLIYALEDDQYKRLRFAEYFAALTISSDLQEKWNIYHNNLESLMTETQNREKELLMAELAGESEKVEKLQKDIADMRLRLEALPKKGFWLKQIRIKDTNGQNISENNDGYSIEAGETVEMTVDYDAPRDQSIVISWVVKNGLLDSGHDQKTIKYTAPAEKGYDEVRVSLLDKQTGVEINRFIRIRIQ